MRADEGEGRDFAKRQYRMRADEIAQCSAGGLIKVFFKSKGYKRKERQMSIKETTYYANEIEKIKQELKKLPDGRLVRRESRYYVKIGAEQKGVTKDRQLLRNLARKAYLQRRLKHLEWNMSLAEKFYKQSKTEDPVEIIEGLSSCFQELPIDCFFHPAAQAENVSGDSASKNQSHPERLIYMTLSGIRVRSKSERTIADALTQKRILYRYEAELALGGVVRNPDFTITRPSDGKTFLLEHFGLMGDDVYRSRTIEKLTLYAKHGFFPNDNLICTYEDDLQNPAHIHAIIDAFLLT